MGGNGDPHIYVSMLPMLFIRNVKRSKSCGHNTVYNVTRLPLLSTDNLSTRQMYVRRLTAIGGHCGASRDSAVIAYIVGRG